MPRRVAGCHRPAVSCARCRAKKIKCDKKDPCSQCVSAYVKCTNANADGSEGVPRSITQFLRDDIRRLEIKLQSSSPHSQSQSQSQLSRGGTTQAGTGRMPSTRRRDGGGPETSSMAAQPALHRPVNHALARARRCSSIQKITRSMTPSQTSASNIPHKMMSLTSSRVFVSAAPGNAGGDTQPPPVSDEAAELIGVKSLAFMPPRIVSTLVKVFIEKVHCLLPLVHEPTLWTQLVRVLRIIHDDQTTRVVADYDFLVIHLVLAIAVSLGSATSGHGQQRMAFSESLFQDGIKHLSHPDIFPSDMSELQFILLVLHYGTINPRCASVWMLSGSAMRLCLKLGLHREAEDETHPNALFADMRRRLFWMSYCFDRHVCAAIQYPISLSDAAIDVYHFSPLDDKYLSSEHMPRDAVALSKVPALHWLEYRQIHSDMVEVHFKGKSFGPSWEAWLGIMEEKIRIWYDKQRETFPWTETAYHNALTYLHRPSPLTPKPTPRSLLIAFENACAVASSYGKDIQAGYFRRPWLAAHHTFGSAVIVLFCLRHGSNLILTKFGPDDVSAMTTLFSLNLQSVSSQFWPEVSRCLEVYNRLLHPLIVAIMSGNDPTHTFTQEQDEELAHLLYPGTTRFEALATENNLALPSLDPNYLPEQDVDAFDWDLSRFEDSVWDETTFDFLNDQSYTPNWTAGFLAT